MPSSTQVPDLVSEYESSQKAPPSQSSASSAPDLVGEFESQQSANSSRESAFAPKPPVPYAKPGPYSTQLSPNDEQQFQKWVKTNSIPWQDTPNADYDMRGYWKGQQSGDPLAQRAESKHFPDKWKTPYDISFSNESMYALPGAPHWVGNRLISPDGKVVFDEDKQGPDGVAEERAQQQPERPDFTQEAIQGKLAPVTGRPTEPSGGTYRNPRTGIATPMPAVPEGNELFDYPILAAEHGIGGASDIMEAEKQAQKAPGAFYTNPRTGQRAPVSTLPPEAQRREEAGTAEVLQGVGEASTPLVAASGLQAPIGLARGLVTGYVAGKGAKYVTKKAGGSPEAQAEAEAVGFFLPSAAEVLSGLKTGRIQTPEGKFSAASAFGGRVRGGVATTPEAFDIRGQVGGTTVGVRIPRGGASVPETPPDFTGMRTGSLPNRFNPIVVHPEPSEAAKALLDFEQHSGNPEYQPPPPASQPPQATGPDHLTPEIAKGITDVITRAPAAQRPNLIMEAHGNMVKWMMTKGTFTGPDGKIYTVDNEGQAKKLANTFINGEIDKFDKAQQEAAKAAASKPAQAPTNGAGSTSKPAKAPTKQPVKTAQPVPVNQTPDIQHVPGPTGQPMGAGMTKDSPAVRAVHQQADLAPGQVPDVMVKKEAPSNAAKLAQPAKEPKPENLAKVGTEDKESGRQIVQPSTSAIENERLAAEAAPELATHLSQIAAQVPGAKFDRMRPQKNIDRVGDKTEGGKPPETIQDYVAAQIAADSPEAKNKLLVELEKTGRVLSVEDKFLEPRKDLAGYASTNVQYQLSNGASAEVQIVPREIQEITDQSHHFYTEGRKAKERGDHAEAEKNFKEAARITGAALDRFKERNGLNDKPQHDFASTQINIDKNSELGQAHAAAVAGIPEQHIGKEGRESTPHVTVRYGLKNDSPEAIQKIRDAVGKIQPFEVPIGKNEVFPATEHSSYDHPVVARLQPTPELQALRSAVESAGGFKEDNFPEYKPHVTLAYIKPEFAQQYKGGNHLEGQKVPVDHIVVTKKNGSEEAIALGTAKTPDLVAEHEAGNVPDLVAEHEGKTYSGPERRTHLAERKRVEHMTPEEMKRTLLTSEVTGLPNRRAFDENEHQQPARSVAMSDADGLKALNDKFGYDAGNALLKAKAEALTQAGLDAYHEKGDEFLYRGLSPNDLKAKLDRAREILRNRVIEVQTTDGRKLQFKGADFSYGTGKDLSEAESGLKAHKSEREARGERARGELRGITEVTQGEGQEYPSAAEGPRGELAKVAAGSIPKPGTAGSVPVHALNFDPRRFQYKLNTNEKGVTNALEGRKFNPELAGQISVWLDPEDGNLYVINGHHRAQLAIESKHPKIQAWHIDVPDATSARARGALQNIAEGSGTSVDAAKFFRDSGMSVEDLEKHGITLTAAKAKEGLALARLTPFLFDKVVAHDLPTARAVAIGEATGDHAQQEAIWKLVEKQEAKGRKVTNDTVAELARFVASSGNRTVEQGGLFGANQEIHSLALEKAEISSYIKQQIAKERRAFAAVSSEERTGTLKRVEGQQIKAGENKKIADAAARAEEAYNKLSSVAGPVNDALDKAARELSSGNYRPEEVKQRAYAAVREEIQKALPRGDDGGPQGLQARAGRREGAEEHPALSLEHPAPAFFSKAEKAAEEKLPKNVSAQSVIPTLKNAGVKEEELKWLGLDDWLKDRKLVSKQEVLDKIRQNNVQVQEVEKSEKQLPEMRWLESKSGYGRPMWVTNVGRREFSITKVGDAHTGEEFTLYRTRHEGDEYIGHFDTLEEAQRIAQQEAAGKGHNAPKFSQYQLPGGSNYRELLLTLPIPKDEVVPVHGAIRDPGRTASPVFHSGHFDEPNVLAHVRFNDRISPDGKKTLFIEEVQSDWHQMGRKQGYRSAISERELKQLEEKRLAAWREVMPLVKAADNLGYDSASQVSGDLASGALNPDHIDETGVPGLRAAARIYAEIAKEYREAKKQSETGVPDAPFKTTWHELAMKRMLRYAAEHGYDRIAWTTGAQQAARYDLSKHIDSLNWQKNPDGTYNISPLKNGEAVGNASMQRVAPDKLADVIGKEVAEKIINGHGQTWTDNKGTAQGELSNLDLKVGGSGMKGFYDKILPDFMNKYGKKWGAKVGTAVIPVNDNWKVVNGILRDEQGSPVPVETEGRGPRKGMEPVHSIDITPAMKHDVLYEGQPLFNLSKPELHDWLKAAGPGRIKIEEMGEQGGLFGSSEKMFRLFTSKQSSVAVTENQLKELGSAVPSFGRKLRERDIIADDAVSVDYQPPEPASLFGTQKPPVLTISRGARDLINQLTSFGQRFQGANISVGNARKIAAQLLDEPGVGARAQAELDEIPEDKKADARRIGEALRQAAQDAGNSGITIHKEGLPQHAVEEEAFHAGQRELGRGEVSRHLSAEAVNRIMEHPASAKLQKALKAQGYPENAPKEYQVSEMAAKIAVGQHDLHPAEAADWFIRYLDELHQEHGIGNVAAAFANLYDGARDYYERAREDLAARTSRSGGRESGIQQTAGGVPEHPTGAAPPQTGRGNRQDQAGRQGSLDQPFLLSRDKSAAEPPALSLQDDVDYFLPSVAKQRDSEPASTAKPAPGTRSAHTGNETRLNEIQQLTDAIAQNRPRASLADRLKFARNKGGEDAGGGELNTITGRIKGTFAALKSAMTSPPKFGDYEKATGEWSGADQRSALDLYRFTKAIKEAVPEKLKREAISNWIEAGGDDQVLQERADASKPTYKPGYEAALKLTDAEKTIAQNIMNLHDATLQEAIKAGIVEGGVENYIQHIYSNQPAMVNRIRAELNFNTLKTNPSFSKRRVLPTYFDAEQLGFEPKDKDVGYLTSVHERSLREALAARAYIKSLNQGKEDDGRPLLIASWASAKEVAGEDDEGNPLDPAYLIKPNLPRGEQYADYMTLDHPALRGWKWAAEIDGKPVFVKGDVLVHPAIYRKLKNNLGRSALRNYETTVGGVTFRPGELALKAISEVKHFILSYSGFHQTTLALHGLEHKVNIADLPELDLNEPVQAGLVDHGMIVAHYDAEDAFGEGLASGGLADKTPLIGPMYQTYREYLFRSFLPRLKMKMGKDAFARNKERYPDLSDDQIYTLTAEQANSAFGGLNYRMLGRNKTFQDTLRLFLMAPDFFEARARFVGQAAKPFGREQFAAYMLGAAALYTLARLLNYWLDNKDPHWSKPFAVVHDGKEYQLRTVQGDTVDFVTDPKRFLRNRVSPPVSTLFSDDKYRKKHESILDEIKSRGEGAVPIPAQPWMYESRDSNAEKAFDSVMKMIGINERKEQKHR